MDAHSPKAGAGNRPRYMICNAHLGNWEFPASEMRILEAVLKAAGIGKGEIIRIAADDVIEHADSDNGAGLDKPGGAIAILEARGRIAAWMVAFHIIAGLLEIRAALKISTTAKPDSVIANVDSSRRSMAA